MCLQDWASELYTQVEVNPATKSEWCHMSS